MKKIIIVLVAAVFVYFILYNPSEIAIEGNWTVQKITYNDKELYDNAIDVEINSWADSLYIFDREDPTSASFNIKYDQAKPYVLMTSKQDFLNGKFDLTLDTIPQNFYNVGGFIVDMKLRSDHTYLHLQHSVYPQPPKKAEFPRRGAP